MSISILKRSLDIVDEDETKKKQKKKPENLKKKANLFDFEEKKVNILILYVHLYNIFFHRYKKRTFWT